MRLSGETEDGSCRLCRNLGLILVSTALLIVDAVRASAAPGNDYFTNRYVLFGFTNVINTDNSGATKEPGEPRHAGNNLGGHSVWWTWTAPESAPVTIDTIGSTFDTLLGVYTGTSV